MTEVPKLTTADFARVAGRSEKTVRNWIKRGMPHPKEDPEGAIAWAIEHAGQDTLDVKARNRWELARAEKLELENQQRRRLLVPLADMNVIAAEAGALFASRLDALAGRLANELAGISEPGVIRERIRRETTGIRQAVADRLTLLGSLSSDGDSDPAVADSEPGRVGERQPDPAGGERGAGTVSD